MARDVAGLLVCNLLFFAAGAGVVRLLGAWRSPRGLLRMLGVAYLAGIAAAGVTLQTALVLGAPFDRWVVITVCGGLALSGLLTRRPVDSRPGPYPATFPAYLWPAAAALAAIVALMAVDLWFQPLGVWDAWAQWTAKARSLVVFRGLDANVFSSAAYRAWNPDYPLLLPSVEASDFSFMRHIDTRAIHIQFFLIYAAFLLALIQCLRGHVREVLVWPLVLAIAVSPMVQILTASALADVPVGVFFAMAGLFAWRWVVDADPRAPWLFAVFAAGAYATKFEGRIFIGALSVTMIALTARGPRNRLRVTLTAAAVPLVGLVPWSLWVSHHHVVGIFSTSLRARLGVGLIDKADRIPLILDALGRNALNPSRWLLLAFVIVASLVVAWVALADRGGLWLVVGTVALTTVGLVLVYWATPLELHWHLRQSARRVVTGPMLFAAVLLPLLLESALQARGQKPPGKE